VCLAFKTEGLEEHGLKKSQCLTFFSSQYNKKKLAANGVLFVAIIFGHL